MTAYKLPAVLAFLVLCTVSALMAPRRATLPAEAIEAPAPVRSPASAPMTAGGAVHIPCRTGNTPGCFWLRWPEGCPEAYDTAITRCPGETEVLDLFCGVNP